MSMNLYRETVDGRYYECHHCGAEEFVADDKREPVCPDLANHDDVDDGWDLDDGFPETD